MTQIELIQEIKKAIIDRYDEKLIIHSVDIVPASDVILVNRALRSEMCLFFKSFPELAKELQKIKKQEMKKFFENNLENN